jgi:hypothetical protein
MSDFDEMMQDWYDANMQGKEDMFAEATDRMIDAETQLAHVTAGAELQRLELEAMRAENEQLRDAITLFCARVAPEEMTDDEEYKINGGWCIELAAALSRASGQE